MANLLNFVDQNADTLQQMALLAYLKEPDVGEPLLQAITTYKVSFIEISKELHLEWGFYNYFKVGRSVFKYVSKDDEIERIRNETIVNIAAYVKANPRARPQEIQKKVEEEIELFKVKINALWYCITHTTHTNACFLFKKNV